MSKYRIVQSQYLDNEFIDKINKLCDNGYEPVGGLCYNTFSKIYSQVLFLKENKG